ncbi:MAG: ATP-binding cassette domain-containing protein, partial [Chitinophagaceae bacterium]
CTRCKGLGFSYQFEMDAIFPNRDLSIKNGGIAPFGKDIDYWSLSIIKAVLKKHNFRLTDPISKLSEDAIQEMLYGSDEKLKVDYNYNEFNVEFDGLVRHFESVIIGNSGSGALKEALEGIGHLADCPECNGYRLKQEALYFKVGDKNIGEAATMQLDLFYEWILEHNKTLTDRERLIAGEIIKEISTRTKFLLDVGLTYLTLHRPAFSLSGGEAQRIRLATQIGSQLINVTYILDEPSIGLHQRDNVRLIDALKNLRDIGNTVIVVEHDKDMILASDYIVDIGPGAGTHGGKIVAEGNAEEILTQNSLTVQYLNGTKEIATPTERRPGNGNFLELKGASGHNLKNVNIKLPLGTLICVTGVSGSGKSTLITDTLYPILKKYYFRSNAYAMPHKSVSGLEAKIRGYQPGRFSFNVKGGRCEECGGAGIKTVEMNFLPDVYVECPVCLGKRYNRETLEVRYKGKSISDVLDMTVEHAVDFFEMIPAIKRKLQTLNDVGLGYIRLGQSSTTLSGGEAQRVKLATELSKKDTGKTFYILDEPTTGLHFEDIRILMEVLTKLVDRGNTVLIIEHNLDVIKLADYIIDLGPEGGNGGGKIIADGTPEVVAMSKKSITGQFLRKELGI